MKTYTSEQVADILHVREQTRAQTGPERQAAKLQDWYRLAVYRGRFAAVCREPAAHPETGDRPMTALALDTHAYVKKLEAAGFTEQQAEVLAATQAELLTEQLATKADIANVQRDLKDVEAALKQDIETLRAEVKQELRVQEERNDGRFRLLYWMLGCNLALTVAVLWLLIRH